MVSMTTGSQGAGDIDVVQVEIVEAGQSGGGRLVSYSDRQSSRLLRGKTRTGLALALIAVAVLVVGGAGVARRVGQLSGTPRMAFENGPDVPAIVPGVNPLAKLGEQVSVYGFTGFGLAYPPTVMRLDLGTGVEVDTQIPEIGSNSPVSVVPDAGGVIVRPWSGGVGYRVPDGEPASALRGLLGSGSGPVLPGPTLGTFWTADAASDTATAADRGPTAMVLVDTAGQLVGPRISLRSDVDSVSSDGAGGIITVGPGNEIFAMNEDQKNQSAGTENSTATGRRQNATGIGQGRLIAASSGGFVYLSCGDPTCGLTFVDRGLQLRKTIAIPPEMGTIVGGMLSPDGTQLAALLQLPAGGSPAWSSAQPAGAPTAADDTNSPVLAMYDLSTAKDRLTPSISPDPVAGSDALGWSPDSRWLFVSNGHGQLIAASADGRETLIGRVAVPYLNYLTVTPAN